MRLSVWVLILSWYGVLRAAFGILISDDAYITLSHARTWIEHGLPVMSPHNPVNAATSPLYTALLTLPALPWKEGLEWIAFGINIPLDLLSIFLVYRIMRALRSPRSWALLAAGTFALSLGTMAAGAAGLETTLFTAANLLGIYWTLKPASCISQRILLCALPLIRPEGLLTAALLVGADGLRNKIPARIGFNVLAVMTGIGAFIAFYRLSYGHFLPHSIVAKSALLNHGWIHGLHAWLAHGFLKGPIFGGLRTTLIINTVAASAGLAGLIRARNRDVLPLVFWTLIYAAFFLVTGKGDIQSPWYFSPAIPFGIILVIRGLSNILPTRALPSWSYGILTILVPILAGSMMMAQRLPQTYRRVYGERELRYRAAADMIVHEAGTSETIMTDEVGAVAFFSRMRILDSHGLLSPEVLAFADLRKQYRGYVGRLVEEFKPEWIIGMWPTEIEHRIDGHEAAIFGEYRLFKILGNPGSTENLEIWRKNE